MNYQKLDAALAMAVSQVSPSTEANLVVFIHTQKLLDADAAAFLQKLGISNIAENMDIFTATISVDTLSELSQQTWIQSIKLSQKLHLAKKI